MTADQQAALIIADIIARHTVSGYTSWPAVAVSMQTEIVRLCRDIARLDGSGLRADRGCSLQRMPLGAASVVVETYFEPADTDGAGQREGGCYRVSGALINGVMVSADDLPDELVERWESVLEQKADRAADDAFYDMAEAA